MLTDEEVQQVLDVIDARLRRCICMRNYVPLEHWQAHMVGCPVGIAALLRGEKL